MPCRKLETLPVLPSPILSIQQSATGTALRLRLRCNQSLAGMESFDNENDDKRTQQVLSSDVQARVVEAFEVFDHENNKTVDVREVGTIVRSLGHCPMESQLQEVGLAGGG